MSDIVNIKLLMRGLLVPVRLNPGALQWTVAVCRSRFNPIDIYPVQGFKIDHTNERIILNTWSPHYQSALLDQKDVADLPDNRIG